MPDQSIFDAWAAEYTPKFEPVFVCFDGDLSSRLSEALASAAQFTDSKMLGGPTELKKRVEDLTAQVQEKTHKLVFTSVGRKRWRDLLADHPPREEDRTKGLDHNPETFYTAAMALTCTEPGLTVAQAQWILEHVTEEDALRVTGACFEANISAVKIPKAATAKAQRGGKKSTHR